MTIKEVRGLPRWQPSFYEAKAAFEKDLIKKALMTAYGNHIAACHLLGITRRQLEYKMKEYGLETNEAKPRLATLTVMKDRLVPREKRTIGLDEVVVDRCES